MMMMMVIVVVGVVVVVVVVVVICNGSGVHPAYLTGIMGSFPGGKAAEA
jgi:hypothetical protein